MWKNKVFNLVIMTVLILSILSFVTTNKAEASLRTTLYVGGSEPGNYTTIQSAIDNASDGDTIFVFNGTYYENIMMDTSLTLRGEHQNATIINASGYSDVIAVTAPNCTINGFTLTNSGIQDGGHINCGIYCDNYSPFITNNIITGNKNGIGCWDGATPSVQDNIIINNTNHGIYVYAASPRIENNSIIGNGDAGITLRATATPIISNNTIIYHPRGINCNYVTGSLTRIRDNSISYNQRGIQSDGSYNLTLCSNTIFNNSISGIAFSYSSAHNLIDNNLLFNNSDDGITFSVSSHNNIISNNMLFNNSDISIYLSGSCTNNTIFNNTICQSHVGIHLSSSRYNTLSSNTIQVNQLGIRLFYSSSNNAIQGNIIEGNNISLYIFSNSEFNNVLENTITTSTTRGIYVQSSSNNSIFHNNFIDNTPQARDDGTNVWDHDYPTGGNYWSDFDESSEGSFDNDSDGIIDTPYFIPGGNNSDRYPLMMPYNLTINQPPTCTLSVTPTSGTVPLTVTFTMAASDHDGTIDTWTLDINNDGTAEYSDSGTPPSTQQHTYITTGFYTAKLTVTDDQGATDSYTRTITVQAPSENQVPTCTITVNPASGTAPLTVTFTITSSDPDGSITTWSLDIDNDGTSDYAGSGPPPSTQQTTYQTIGAYIVNLTVTDNHGASSSDTIVITVTQTQQNQLPTCTLSANPSSGYAPLSVIFTLSGNDPDGSIASWTLDINNDGTADYFGSGIPPSTQQHTYTTVGTYTAKLTVTDNQGSTASTTKTITVSQQSQNQVPTCTLTANPTSGTPPLTVTFTLTASDPDGTIATWTLDTNNDGTPEYSNSGSPPSTRQHIYQIGGDYTVKFMVIDNDGATDSDTKIITVSQAPQNQIPIANFDISKDNLKVTFQDTSTDSDGNITDWNWDFGDGTSSDLKNPIHTYNDGGLYNITLTVTDNNGDTDTYSKIITVENDGDGIPGFEFIPFILSILGLLFLARRKRKHGYK